MILSKNLKQEKSALCVKNNNSVIERNKTNVKTWKWVVNCECVMHAKAKKMSQWIANEVVVGRSICCSNFVIIMEICSLSDSTYLAHTSRLRLYFCVTSNSNEQAFHQHEKLFNHFQTKRMSPKITVLRWKNSFSWIFATELIHLEWRPCDVFVLLQNVESVRKWQQANAGHLLFRAHCERTSWRQKCYYSLEV